jgi:uncharacterized protein (DUF362 family)
VGEVLEHFGEAGSLLKSSGDVYLKVNAVDLKNYSSSDPEVIRETILYFKNSGVGNIYVIENCLSQLQAASEIRGYLPLGTT